MDNLSNPHNAPHINQRLPTVMQDPTHHGPFLLFFRLSLAFADDDTSPWMHCYSPFLDSHPRSVHDGWPNPCPGYPTRPFSSTNLHLPRMLPTGHFTIARMRPQWAAFHLDQNLTVSGLHRPPVLIHTRLPFLLYDCRDGQRREAYLQHAAKNSRLPYLYANAAR